MMDERHAFWLAALIDGEGSIIIRRREGRPPQVVISIGQNDRRLLDRAVEYADAGRVYAGIGPRKAGHQLQIIRRDDVRRVLTAVQPHLVLKGEKALEALSVIDSGGTRQPRHRVRGRFATKPVEVP